MKASYFNSESYTPPMVNRQTFFTNSFDNFSFPKHFHEEYLVVTIKEGRNDLFCSGKSYTAFPGDVILINPGEVHDGNSYKNGYLHYNVFYIDPYSLTQMLEHSYYLPGINSCSFSQTHLKQSLLANKINHFYSCLAKEYVDEIYLHEQYLDIIQDIAVNYSTSKPDNYAFDSYYGSKVKELKEYINDNLGSKLSLQYLSGICFISPFHLLKVFQRFTGITLHQYILVRRIEKAKEMLRNKKSIGDVAFLLGFTDQSHFTRSFKKMIGMTPGEYQQAYNIASAPE